MNIDDLIDAWHNGAGAGLALHEYLGWTWEEYVQWVRNPGSLTKPEGRQ